MIELNNVSKSFGPVKAVNRIFLRIEKGELFSFLGPNGAGKTTTIKMIVGLLTPDSGTVHIDAINIAQDPVAVKKIIGYMPDTPFLYEKLTGKEFLHLMGNLHDMTHKEITRQIEYYKERLDMKEWLDDRIESYSRGMKQRIVFTSSFLHDPKVLVIDEPMVGLDPKTARVVKDLLKEKTKDGVTVFLSTHDLHVAEILSDQIAIIHKGRILGKGPIQAFRDSTYHTRSLEELFLEIVEKEEASWKEGGSESHNFFSKIT